MTYMRSADNKRLDDFYPQRDLPGLTARGWWVADDVAGSNGSTVALWKDRSGRNASLVQPTVASRPTVKTAAANGHRSVAFNGSQLVQRATFGSYPVPSTVAAVIKAGTQVASFPGIIAGATGTDHRLYLENATGCIGHLAGGSSRGGPTLLDGAFHVAIGVACADASGRLYLDGYQVGGAGSGNTQTQSGVLALGGIIGGQKFVGEIAEALWLSGEATPEHVNLLVSTLATKYGVVLP